MPQKESLYPADWLRVAEKDLNRVERLLNQHDPEIFPLQFSLDFSFCILNFRLNPCLTSR